MSQPLSPELERQAQELAARLQTRTAETFLDLARRLVTTQEETLFGQTELDLRDTALDIVGHAYDEHLEKKVATTAAVSLVPIAKALRTSTATATRISKPSAVP